MNSDCTFMTFSTMCSELYLAQLYIDTRGCGHLQAL